MKNIIALILFTMLIVSSCKFFKSTDHIGPDFPQLIRTDFSNDKNWKKVENQLLNPKNKFGFKPYINIVEEKVYNTTLNNDLKLMLQLSSYPHLFFFIVDSVSINHPENPILCISLDDENKIDRFRVVPKDLWIIENNLSTANLLFDELLYSVDDDGIHRAE